MVFLFKDRSDINVLFLALLSVAVHFHFYLEPPIVIANPTDGLLAYLLFHYIKPLPPLALIVLFHLIVIVQALRLNILVSRFKMFQQVSYLPAFTFVVLTALFPFWDAISSGLIANAFIIWILVKLNRLYDQTQPKTLEFNIGMIVGVSILLYEPIAILIPVVIFALVIIRPFRLTEWLVLMMGILMPFYFLGSYLFLFDQWHLFVNFLPSFQFHLPIQNINLSIGLAISILFVCLLFGIFYNQANSSRNVIQIRKNWGVMMLLLLLMLPVSFVFRATNLNTAILCLVPSAAFAANAYSYPKRLIIPNILFWLTVALLVYNNWILIKN